MSNLRIFFFFSSEFFVSNFWLFWAPVMIYWWWIFLRHFWPTKGIYVLFPARTIVRDTHHYKSPTLHERIWRCVESEFRLSWMKLCGSDNHCTTISFCFLFINLFTNLHGLLQRWTVGKWGVNRTLWPRDYAPVFFYLSDINITDNVNLYVW